MTSPRDIPLLLVTIMLVGCSAASDKPSDMPTPSAANTTVASLRNYASSGVAHIVRDDMVLSGRVTSSDAEGNFYRSFVVQDATGGVEVLVDMYDLSAIYPEGTLLSLHLAGCAVAIDDGVLQVGSKAAEYDTRLLEPIASRQLIDRVVRRSDDVVVVEAEPMRIADMDMSACGRKLRIDSLHLVAASSVDTLAGMTLSDARWSGTTLFCDERGDSIAVVTSPYARFAEERVPHGELSITGILSWAAYAGAGCYHLRMSYAEDCAVY